MNVGVFGSSLPAEGSRAYEDARKIGHGLARRGATVVCGGYAGVMEAACRGAAEGGGESVGVVLAGRGRPNPWVTRALVAKDLADRLRSLRDMPGAWIFLPRGLGTLLELVWLCESIVKGEAPARPLVLFGDFWNETVDTALRESSSREGAAVLSGAIRYAADPGQAVSLALD